jgi:hypothetical protein
MLLYLFTQDQNDAIEFAFTNSTSHFHAVEFGDTGAVLAIGCVLLVFAICVAILVYEVRTPPTMS